MLQLQTIFAFAIHWGQVHLGSGAKIGLPDIELVPTAYVNIIRQAKRRLVANSDFYAEERGDLESMVLDQNQQTKPEPKVLS